MTRPAPIILVVDDELEIRCAIDDILQLEGYRTALAKDGQEALELLEGGLRPKLILLDLMMPRMSGEQFLRRRAEQPTLREIPVVIVSAMPYEARALAPLVEGVLAKPFLLEQLLEVVAEHCERPPQG
jgi:two-component system chemotaxis response regulator CheY